MTAKIEIFDKYYDEYDKWFDFHPWVYRSELEAVRKFLPQNGKGVEIGAGTGRFSIPFGITVGVEPSKTMADIAKSRGMTICDAKAENLPFDDNAFDFVLLVTTICFLEDPLQALKEIRRILRPDGKIIIGMLDKDSLLGKLYEIKKKDSSFSDMPISIRSIKFWNGSSYWDTVMSGFFKRSFVPQKKLPL